VSFTPMSSTSIEPGHIKASDSSFQNNKEEVTEEIKPSIFSADASSSQHTRR